MTAYQRVILVSVLQCYFLDEKEMEEINELELKEEYFTGYFKSVVRTINILRKTNPIVNDDMVEEFLVSKNHFNQREYIAILTTLGTSLSCLKWYIDKLRGEYTKRLLK